jgi:ribosomal protein L16/L10AE
MKVFTDISVSKKHVGSRMGAGVGSHHKWVSLVKKGQVIVEVLIPLEKLSLSIKALKSASSKIALKTVLFYNFY